MSRFAALEEFIQERMAKTHLPAVSIALVERRETVPIGLNGQTPYERLRERLSFAPSVTDQF